MIREGIEVDGKGTGNFLKGGSQTQKKGPDTSLEKMRRFQRSVWSNHSRDNGLDKMVRHHNHDTPSGNSNKQRILHLSLGMEILLPDKNLTVKGRTRKLERGWKLEFF